MASHTSSHAVRYILEQAPGEMPIVPPRSVDPFISNIAELSASNFVRYQLQQQVDMHIRPAFRSSRNNNVSIDLFSRSYAKVDSEENAARDATYNANVAAGVRSAHLEVGRLLGLTGDQLEIYATEQTQQGCFYDSKPATDQIAAARANAENLRLLRSQVDRAYEAGGGNNGAANKDAAWQAFVERHDLRHHDVTQEEIAAITARATLLEQQHDPHANKHTEFERLNDELREINQQFRSHHSHGGNEGRAHNYFGTYHTHGGNDSNVYNHVTSYHVGSGSERLAHMEGSRESPMVEYSVAVNSNADNLQELRRRFDRAYDVAGGTEGAANKDAAWQAFIERKELQQRNVTQEDISTMTARVILLEQQRDAFIAQGYGHMEWQRVGQRSHMVDPSETSAEEVTGAVRIHLQLIANALARNLDARGVPREDGGTGVTVNGTGEKPMLMQISRSTRELHELKSRVTDVLKERNPSLQGEELQREVNAQMQSLIGDEVPRTAADYDREHNRLTGQAVSAAPDMPGLPGSGRPALDAIPDGGIIGTVGKRLGEAENKPLAQQKSDDEKISGISAQETHDSGKTYSEFTDQSASQTVYKNNAKDWGTVGPPLGSPERAVWLKANKDKLVTNEQGEQVIGNPKDVKVPERKSQEELKADMEFAKKAAAATPIAHREFIAMNGYEEVAPHAQGAAVPSVGVKTASTPCKKGSVSGNRSSIR